MNYRKLLQLAIAGSVLTLLPSVVRAELIPLSFSFSPTDGTVISPDLTPSPIHVDYNATTHDFTASGFVSGLSFIYDDGTGVEGYEVEDGLFSITAKIDNFGHLIGAGSLSIAGNIPGLPPGVANANTGTLLTGNLAQFGFDEVEDGTLQFAFQTAGGALSGLYPGVGVLLSETGFSGSFSASFNNDGAEDNAFADVGAIPDPGPPVGDTPEPGTLFLFGSAAGLLLLKVRQSKAA